jgi:voltage-gated potassium channel Kch
MISFHCSTSNLHLSLSLSLFLSLTFHILVFFYFFFFSSSSSFYFQGRVSVRLLVVIDSLRRNARSFVIIKTPLQEEKDAQTGSLERIPSIIRVNPHGIVAVVVV